MYFVVYPRTRLIEMTAKRRHFEASRSGGFSFRTFRKCSSKCSTSIDRSLSFCLSFLHVELGLNPRSFSGTGQYVQDVLKKLPPHNDPTDDCMPEDVFFFFFTTNINVNCSSCGGRFFFSKQHGVNELSCPYKKKKRKEKKCKLVFVSPLILYTSSCYWML